MLRWRAMSACDLDAVVALAARIHVDHPERGEVLAEKLTLFPDGCFTLEGIGSAPADSVRT